MSRILLDTSAYSAFRRGHPQIQHRIREASEIQVSPIVLGELRGGFLKGTRLAENLAGLAQFLASPRVEVVLVEEETAERYALILDSLRRAGTPIPVNDVWIAASAMQYGSVLLTTDPHFRAVAQIAAEILEPHLSKPQA
ncbi:MAG TPA: type II toxin-antitoxin system VapC family toxin [Thermoanaerobaculia bacterium]|nr:type II toxin-antitoxin system VapC family toxin [Thermoanaerobaculia bacterium]